MDELDRRLLAILQANGRKTNADLARELGLAPSTVLERVRKLEERGALQGYRAIVASEALGLQVQAFVSVTLDRHDEKLIRAFEEDVQKLPHVRACYHLTGRFDYLLQIAARDMPHLGEIIKTRIASIAGIGKAETFLVMSEIKSDQGWPVEEPTAKE